MIELNYNPKLTLICNIAVVKSIAIPKLVHAMTVLPNSGKQILNKV